MKLSFAVLIQSILVISLFLSACSPRIVRVTPTMTKAPTETNTPHPTLTITPSITSSPTLTPTFTETPTPTKIPEELRNQIIQSYGTMLFIQANLVLLDETAQRVQSGELSGFDTLGAMIAIAAFVNAIDEAIPEIEPPKPFNSYWEDMLTIHKELKSIIRRWFNDEIELFNGNR